MNPTALFVKFISACDARRFPNRLGVLMLALGGLALGCSPDAELPNPASDGKPGVKKGARFSALDRQRDALISLHQHIKHRASKVVDVDFETYEERHLVHRMLENPRKEIDIDAIIRKMASDELHYESLLSSFQGRMMRVLSHSSGHIISAPSSTKLPWWAILPKEHK